MFLQPTPCPGDTETENIRIFLYILHFIKLIWEIIIHHNMFNIHSKKEALSVLQMNHNKKLIWSLWMEELVEIYNQMTARGCQSR